MIATLGMAMMFVMLIWHMVGALEDQNKRLIEELQTYRPVPLDLDKADIV